MEYNFDLFDKKVRNKTNFLDKVTLFLYGMYFVISPIYIFKNGLPQLADYILMTSLTLYLISNKYTLKFERSSKQFIRIGFTFVSWIVLINVTWQLIVMESDFIINSIFYIYNFLIVILTLSMYRKYKNNLLNTIINSVVISFVVQLITIIVSGGITTTRVQGTFNNPNQLGYYALLGAGLLLTINALKKIPIKRFLIGLYVSFILVILSLSNAAIISWIIMFASHFFLNKSIDVKLKRRILILTLSIGIIVLIIYYRTPLITENDFYNSLINRLSLTQEKISTSTGTRGYDRLFKFPQYLLIGAGEGAYYRFNTWSEFHSTLGNILLSYGIIGFLIFMNLLYKALWLNKFKMTHILFSAMLYGYSHNGIRNTLLWILISVISIRYSDKEDLKLD